ncbi:MAG: hypothetical protein Q8P72_05195 [Candidatus Roizmanbacteria bacterium]|nr:hypothetical protein [Candidatus Roizmanbacteria bacterium]
MKKYIILLFGLFLFAFVPEIYAQPQQSSGFRATCFDMQYCGDGTCPSGSGHVHRMALSTTTRKAVASSTTYVLECIEADPDPICTTGNSALDIELFCPDTSQMTPQQITDQCDHYNRVTQGDIGYKLSAQGGDYGIWHKDPAFPDDNKKYIRKNEAIPGELTVQSDGQGNVAPIEIQSYTPVARMRKFMMYNKIVGTDAVSAEGGGQSQATLPFIYRSSDCEGGKAYDPYGKVFDMLSLEPIPNVQVNLNQHNTVTDALINATIANPHIVNPFKTSSIGYFTFYVVDGNYSLSPTHTEYTHAVQAIDMSLIPTNVHRIYSDLYFQDSPRIQQRGAIQHRDVVMKPNSGIGVRYPLDLLDESRTEQNGKLIYKGLISHPFVLLNVEICTPGTPETCTLYKEFDQRNGGPDKGGKFSITLDQSALNSLTGEYFNMKFIKQDLTTAILTYDRNAVSHVVAWFQKLVERVVGVVQAQEVGTLESKVEPIPVYLEGYAYDNEGSIMPNATVGIYMYLFKNSPIYQTSADINGFFRITTENIPSAEYSLRFTSVANPEVISYQSTSQFLANNGEFIKAEKVNPYKLTSASTNPRRNVTPSFVPEQKISPLVTIVSPTRVAVPSGTPEAVTTTTTSRNPMYLIGAVLLILLGGAGVMLAIYVYKKKSQETVEQE